LAITLPDDSVLLDGRSSNNPDGRISGWLWTKIAGPVSFNVNQISNSMTMVKAPLQFSIFKSNNETSLRRYQGLFLAEACS
jgi:hypothetical protein